jgi:PAS domain S-box-containing protein
MSISVSKNKLLKKSKGLEDEVAQLRQLATILIDRTDWYQTIFNNCPFGIVITDLDYKIQDANAAFLDMLSYTSFEGLKESTIEKLIPEENRCEDPIKEKIIEELFDEGIIKVNSSFLTVNGSIVPVKLTACIARNDQGKPLKIAGFVENDSLQAWFDEQMKQKDLEIRRLKKMLEEKKSFQKLIFEQARKNQKDMEESIVLNVKELVFPYLGKLQQTTNPTDIQKEYIEILESQLNEIISPFYSELSSKHPDLTPREISIARLVKDGITTKKMARILNLSTGTVEFHRNNLRKKLGIRNTRVSLRSYLLAID